ncbi:MAG: biotin/lipoyl-containing protein [Pseudomonadota bacterium]
MGGIAILGLWVMLGGRGHLPVANPCNSGLTIDLLMTIEAMKMETAINADRSGTITKLHVAAGSQIDAKDLLLELA